MVRSSFWSSRVRVAPAGEELYDAGADGILFWDPSDTCRNGVLWPSISRMGHVDELRLRADLGAPPATTLKLARLDNHVYGRWTRMDGF